MGGIWLTLEMKSSETGSRGLSRAPAGSTGWLSSHSDCFYSNQRVWRRKTIVVFLPLMLTPCGAASALSPQTVPALGEAVDFSTFPPRRQAMARAPAASIFWMPLLFFSFRH